MGEREWCWRVVFGRTRRLSPYGGAREFNAVWVGGVSGRDDHVIRGGRERN